MSYILLPKESIIVGGWHGKDGKSEPFATDVDGFWGHINFVGIDDPRQKIHYALEIDTFSDINDDDIGCVDGIMRFITDRPDYNGLVGPYPSWGPNENNTGNILYKWFTGFIVKDSIANPSRNIDLQIAGDYGNISNFGFSLKNNLKFWKMLEDYEINLLNKSIKVYVIINDKFYEIWNGIISETSRNSTDYIVKCSDNSIGLHRDMPETVEDDKVIPIVVGDNNFVKITKKTEEKVIQLNNNKNSAPIYSYSKHTNSINTDSSLDYFDYWVLNLMTENTFSADELLGKYVKINYFNPNIEDDPESENRKADNDALLYIHKSDQTTNWNTDYGNFNITPVYIKQAPITVPLFHNDDNLEFYTFDHNVMGLKSWITDFVMYVDIIDLKTTYIAGQSGLDIDTNEIYTYDNELKEYIPLNTTVINNGDGTISINIPDNIENSNIPYYYPVDFTINNYRLIDYNRPTFDLRSYITTIDNKPAIYGFMDRADSFPFVFSGGDFNAYIELYGENFNKNYVYGNVSGTAVGIGSNSFILSAFINEDYLEYISDNSNPFLSGSLIFTEESFDEFKNKVTDRSFANNKLIYPISNIGSFGSVAVTITFNQDVKEDDDVYIMADFGVSAFTKDTRLQLVWACIDNYGRRIIPNDDSEDFGREVLFEYISSAGHPTHELLLRGFPESYYTSGEPNLDNFKWIGAIDNYYQDYRIVKLFESGINTYEPEFGKTIFKLPDNYKKMLQEKQISAIQIIISVLQDPSSSFDLVLNQVGCYVKKTVSLDSELYIKVTDNNYNNVYSMFKFILENYDGIPSSAINYHNLSATRTSGSNFNWRCARVFDKVQNSRNYIKELAAHSFVSVYNDRKGKLNLKSFLDIPFSAASNHDSYIVVRDSIDEIETTPIKDTFNSYLLKYDYNAGTNDFDKFISINKANEFISFPSSGDNWKSFVNGIDDYQISKGIWETINNINIQSVSNSPTNYYSDLNYYRYYEDIGDYNSPLHYLINMVNYNSRQKLIVKYDVPITSATVETELGDLVQMKNQVYTNDEWYYGYIINININVKSDTISITALLFPKDSFEEYELPDIPDPDPETGILLIDAMEEDNRDDFKNYDAMCEED